MPRIIQTLADGKQHQQCLFANLSAMLVPPVVCAAVQVVLAGTGVSGEQVAAVAECLASYPAVKSVSCLGCSVGSKVGLKAACRTAMVFSTALTSLCCYAGPGSHCFPAAGIWQQVVAWLQVTDAGSVP